MHEMGIASSVLDAVRHESEARGGARVVTVALRIGELAAVDPESLRFCLEALVNGTDLEPLAFQLEFCPRRSRCIRCGDVYPVTESQSNCPQCGSAQSEFAGGDELEFAYMEVEDA